jgi:hypothetical protein
MLNRKNLIAVLVISVFAMMAAAGDHGDMKHKKDMKLVSMEKLPEQVRKTVRAEAGELEVCHVKEAENEEGNTRYYKAVWRKNDQAVKLKVKPNGDIMDRSTAKWEKHEHHGKKMKSSGGGSY